MLSPVPVGKAGRRPKGPLEPRRTKSFIVGKRQDWWGHTLLVLITSISFAALGIVTIYIMYVVGNEVITQMHNQERNRTLHPDANS